MYSELLSFDAVFVIQVSELKNSQIPTNGQLRSTLVDPAVNVVIKRLQIELKEAKKKMLETQEELSAWKFTPDSATGKRLMAKCRQLLQENEDIGKMISSGRLAKLEGELSMQKALCEEMKKNQLEMDEFVQELDVDVEGMQSTIYFLQQQLKEAKDTIASLEKKEGSPKKIDVGGGPRTEVVVTEDNAGRDKAGPDDGSEEEAPLDVVEEEEEQKVETRGRRTRGSATSSSSTTPPPTRTTRQAKREAPASEDDPSPGKRPKRRRAAPQRFTSEEETNVNVEGGEVEKEED